MTTPLAPSARSLAETVANMLSRPGLYVCGDTNHPTALVPIWVDHGQAHSMEVDEGPHVAPAYRPEGLVADGPAALIARLRYEAKSASCSVLAPIAGRAMGILLNEAATALEAMARIPREPTWDMLCAICDSQGWNTAGGIKQAKAMWYAGYDASQAQPSAPKSEPA